VWHIDDVVKATGGLPYDVTRSIFSGVSTDSRNIREGELFVPLKGPNFDGHLFIEEARNRSQGAYLCEKGREEIWRRLGGTAILVDDASKALLDLARYKRKRSGAAFIAITGSNGKTSTKEILVHMLKGVFSVAFNEKNFNNLVGVPNSILSFDAEAELCVLELGTNAKGEIGLLARTVEPDLSLITNVKPSHLDGLGDIAGVLEEKLDVYRFTREGGNIFVNADDLLLATGVAALHREIYTYSLRSDADFRLSVVEGRGWDGYRFEMRLREDTVQASTGLLGEHNLYNILAASAIASTVGLDPGHIVEALENFRPYSMRFNPSRSRGGYLIIDDSYNANPASMTSAIEAFEGLPCDGRRIAVIGDMQELGDETRRYHRELGRLLKRSSLWRVFLVGSLVEETLSELGSEKGELFRDNAEAIQAVQSAAREGDAILVKGSRRSKLEEIVEALR
jgi:UDP-N-acetylmuramoyl-tripeptide--D-alanyl-D-alanine ligase